MTPSPHHTFVPGLFRGQVALVNGCKVEKGRVVEVGIPESALARFQVVEYIRSFSIGRTALGRLDAILIISGVFGIFRKEIVIKDGYLPLDAKTAEKERKLLD